jgi:hypothetical protein
MDTLHELIKSFQKQNQAMQHANSLTSLQNLGAIIAKQQEQQLKFSGINSLLEIVKAFSKQEKAYAPLSKIIDKNFLAKVAAAQTVKLNSPLSNLTATLSDLAKKISLFPITFLPSFQVN